MTSVSRSCGAASVPSHSCTPRGVICGARMSSNFGTKSTAQTVCRTQILALAPGNTLSASVDWSDVD